MSEQFDEILGGPGSGGGGSTSGVVGTVVIGIVNSETELNTLYPATDTQYKDGTFAIVDNLTERKIFFVKNQTWLWSEEFTQTQIDNLITLVNDLKSGIKRLGVFNPKTNTPALPLIPLNANYDAGNYYEITGLALGEEFTWNSLVLTNGDWVIVEKDNSDTVLKWNKRNFGILAKDIFYDNTTSGATSTNLQNSTDETFARIVTLENRPVGNSGEGKRYFISTPETAGIYSATEIFTESPTTITKTFTNVYQTVFEAETEALNITTIPSGGWNTDISFTHTSDKDFTAKLSFYNGATLLGEIESLILAGNEKIVLSKTFPSFAFTSGNKLKFKLEAKSNYNGDISVFTNDGTNDLHIHTPVLIDVVNSAVQNALDLKQNKIIKVNNQANMLALSSAIVGDIVIRVDDNNYQYRLNALPASNLSNWEVLGKDTPPIGETVEDIITTNEVITSKADGLYAFTGTPNGGFPVGVTQGDIAQKTGSVWTVVYTFINAPASIYAKSDGQTYDKKVNSSNVNNWVAKPKPAYYEIGSNKEFSTINSAFAQFVMDGVSVGVGQLYDSEINERVIFPANAQNFLLKGEGYVTRNNNLVNNIEILGHRFTLQKCQPNSNVSLANPTRTVTTTLNSKTIVITGAGQTTSGLVKYQKITGTGIPAMSYIDTIVDSTTFTISQNATANGTNITTTIQPKAPVVIDSSGTITEAGQPNIKRGKHCFDDISFSTPGDSALDIFDIGHFADFRNCHFANKEINLYTTSTTPVYISFTNCQAGVVNIHSPFIVVTKAYSPSVVFQTIISQAGIVDFDKATPVAYSLLRQYSLGQTVSVPLGAMIINDDVGATLQMLKCTTAYTIPVTINTGTPIDLTKYQVETYLHKASQVTSSATNFVLTKDSADSINITGTVAQTVVLPDATTLSLNWYRRIYNTSNQTVTVRLNDGTTQLTTINAGQWIELYATSIATTNGTFLIQSRNFTDAAARILNDVTGFNSTSAPAIAAVSNQFVAQGGRNYIQNGDFLTINTGNANTNLNNVGVAPVGTQAPALQYFPNWYVTSNDANSRVSLSQTEFLGKKYATFEATVGGNGEAFNTRLAGILPKILNKNVTFSFLFRTTDVNIGNIYQARLSYSIDGNATPVFLGSFAINIAAASANLAGSNNVPLLFSQAVSIQGNTTVEQRIARRIQIRNFVLSTPPATPINTLSTPPANPALNDAYIVGANPTGAWATITAGTIVQWNGTGWVTVVAINDAYVVGAAPTGAWAGFAVNSIATWNGANWVNSVGSFSNGFLQLEIQKLSGTDFAQFEIGEFQMAEGLLTTSFEYKNRNINKLLDNVANIGTIPADMVTGGGGGGGSLTITYQANSTTFPANPGTGDKMYVTSDGTGNGIIEEIWEYNGTDWKLIEGVYPVSAAVIDNTIADSQLIENPGRYIVPTTGLLNDFVGQANKYADFDGSVFTFTTPANNDTVQINSGQNAGQVWKYTTISGWFQTSSASATTTLKPPLFGNLIANYSNDLNGTRNALSTAITQGVVKIKKNNTVFNLTNAAQGQALGYTGNYVGLDVYNLSTYLTNPWPNSNYAAAVIQVPQNAKAVFVSFHNDINTNLHLHFMVNYVDGNREHLGHFALQADKINFVCPYVNQVRNSTGYHNWAIIPVHRAGTIELVASQLTQNPLWISRIAFTDNIHNLMVEPALTYHWNLNSHKDPLAAQQFVAGNNINWHGAWYETFLAWQNTNSTNKAYARVRVIKPSDQRSIVLHYQTWDKNSGMPEVWQLRKKDGTYVTVASGSQASPNFQSQDSLWSNQLRSTLYHASFTATATHHLIIPYSIWKDCIQVPTMDNPRLDFLNRNANFTITNAQTNANRCFRISTTVANIAVTAQAPTNAGYFFTVYNTGIFFAFTFAGVSVPANSFKNFIYNFTTATWGEAQNQVECFLDFTFYNNRQEGKYLFNLSTSSDTIF